MKRHENTLNLHPRRPLVDRLRMALVYVFTTLIVFTSFIPYSYAIDPYAYSVNPPKKKASLADHIKRNLKGYNKNGVKEPSMGKSLAGSIGLHIVLGIILGGVDWLMDPDNGTVIVQNKNLECKSSTYGFSADSPEAFIEAAKSYFNDKRSQKVTYRYDEKTRILFREYPNVYNPNDLISVEVGRCDLKPDKPLEVTVYSPEQLAQMMENYAKSGKPGADKVQEYIDQALAEESDIEFEVTKEGVDPSEGDNTGTGDTGDGKGNDPNGEKTQNDLPGFCKWAKIVCDGYNWLKEPPPKPTDGKNTIDDITTLPIKDDRFKSYVNFGGQCPSRNFEVRILNHHIVKPIPYADFCRILAMIAPWLVGFTFIGTGSFVVRNL